MIDFSYLERGLDGLANAHQGGAMAGHPGAALVAAYCFTENNPSLDPGVFRAIERDLERILGGEEGFWIDKKSGVTTQDLFQPLPKVEGAEDGKVGAIVDALGGNLDRTRQSGHNVIFAAAAIRAFSDHPELATPERLLGIVKLTESFDKAGPGRGYYGKSVGWKATIDAALPGDVAKESFESFDEAAEAVIDELIATAGEHRQGFGGLMHLIDHVAGLVELDRHGFSEAARKGFPALKQHLRLLHSLPILNEELGILEKSDRDPRQAEYWSKRDSVQWSGWLTHRLKVLYGFDVILPMIESTEKRTQAEAAFRYLMA